MCNFFCYESLYHTFVRFSAEMARKFLEKKHIYPKEPPQFVQCRISQAQYTKSNIHLVTYAELDTSFGAKLSYLLVQF